MTDRPPTSADSADPADLAGLPEMLASGKDQLHSFALHGKPFGVLCSVHPIASKVLNAAIDEAESRAGIAREDSERCLASTLTTHARFFAKADAEHGYDEEAAIAAFAELTQQWAFDQIASSTAATVMAQLARYRDDLSSELVSEAELHRLDELRELDDRIAHYAELAPKRRQILDEIAKLADSIASRAQEGGPERPAVLSHLLGMTERGRLKPFAVAALITEGNQSVGRQLTHNAVQVLSPSEAAELLNVSRRRLTDRVSELRKAASQAPHRIRPGRHVRRPEDLWTLSPVPKGARA